MRTLLRIFHYSPWYTYRCLELHIEGVENLSLFALIYLQGMPTRRIWGWESFIIRLDILKRRPADHHQMLRIFHYSPWYTYAHRISIKDTVENLSLFALIYLAVPLRFLVNRWESFIIRLDILTVRARCSTTPLRIFHYSPWYTYQTPQPHPKTVENLSLFALIYLIATGENRTNGWESFIIRLDILKIPWDDNSRRLRIFHYSPWYT